MFVGGAPCYGCTERWVGCHGDGVCEQYMEYRKKVDEASAAYRKEQDGMITPNTKIIREHFKKKRRFRTR